MSIAAMGVVFRNRRGHYRRSVEYVVPCQATMSTCSDYAYASTEVMLRNGDTRC